MVSEVVEVKTPGAKPVQFELRDALVRYLTGLRDDGVGGASISPLSIEEIFDRLNGIRDLLHELSPNTTMPVDLVRWVPISMVTPNDYNPNHVAKVEMMLLLRSILADGYTQPIVTVWNPERSLFEIVDGFHRYFTCKSNLELQGLVNGRIPIVVIEKGMNDRMASTVRHNRARGKHSVNGMANMVFQMLDNGADDASICNELGMEPEELLRLKHITGFSKLFKDSAYNRAWQTKNQIMLRQARTAGGTSDGKVAVCSCTHTNFMHEMLESGDHGACTKCDCELFAVNAVHV